MQNKINTIITYFKGTFYIILDIIKNYIKTRYFLNLTSLALCITEIANFMDSLISYLFSFSIVANFYRWIYNLLYGWTGDKVTNSKFAPKAPHKKRQKRKVAKQTNSIFVSNSVSIKQSEVIKRHTTALLLWLSPKNDTPQLPISKKKQQKIKATILAKYSISPATLYVLKGMNFTQLNNFNNRNFSSSASASFNPI
jgi:hypothetical protein